MKCFICGAPAEVAIGASRIFTDEDVGGRLPFFDNLLLAGGLALSQEILIQHQAPPLCRTCYSQLAEHHQAVEALAREQLERNS
ncbi:MAG: hypothetical protein KAY24_01025 [Candidatus Eisenbacteria sp.]|nr:hypothetical protein [Candidatus Eisenbacteria bacterium]